MKTTWNIIKKGTGKVNSVKLFPALLVNDETLKDPTEGKMPSIMLKAFASRINRPLSYIYNHLLYKNIFPDHHRIAVVNLLYKKGDKSSRTDHKPFSLLTIFL